MKTIIVTTDFSSTALNAAEYATNMALGIHANLVLLHVFQTPVLYSRVPLSVTGESIMQVATNEEHIKLDAEKNLEEIKNQLTKKTGGKIDIESEMRFGVFYDELKSVCKRVQPYAVIMGSQGTTATERLFFGGHTVFAMKHLKWPIITVPPDAKYASVQKVVLACDFDEVIDVIGLAPIDEIKKLVHDMNAELHVLNIGKKEIFNPNLVFESGLLKEKLAEVNPAFHFISTENTDEGIIEFTEKNHINLLIILPKRHDLLDKLIHKSHTKQLVLHSHVPVMALHQ
jgi:nucleotide-binding universal stress UspA family protein